MPKAKGTRDVALPDRLARLSVGIQRMRGELARGMETERIEHILELGAIVHRHAEIEKQAKAMRRAPKTRQGRLAATLAADLAGVEKSFQSWIARTDRQRGSG